MSHSLIQLLFIYLKINLFKSITEFIDELINKWFLKECILKSSLLFWKYTIFFMSKRKYIPFIQQVFIESAYVLATVLDTMCCGEQGSEQRDHSEGCCNLSEDEEET